MRDFLKEPPVVRLLRFVQELQLSLHPPVPEVLNPVQIMVVFLHNQTLHGFIYK
jgi:hypothetical protein